jgi:hypothetical protein
MSLDQLKKEIPYQWRVQSFSKYKPEATCVAYIDARDVMNLLDDIIGPDNWQDKYEEHKKNLFCSIGIWCKTDWVWKTDCGTESNVDKEKGEASDAFKRAAVKWGIGRFLYSKKIVRVKANVKKEQNTWPYVVDDRGQRVWDLTKYINNINPPQKDELTDLRDDFKGLKKAGKTNTQDEAYLKEAGGDISKLKAIINAIREREYPEPDEFDGAE